MCEKTISGVTGVESVSAFTYNQALLKSEQRSTGILIRGIEKDSAAAKQIAGYLKEDPNATDKLFNPPPVEITDEQGKPALTSLPGILVGRELLRNFGLAVDATGYSSVSFGFN